MDNLKFALFLIILTTGKILEILYLVHQSKLHSCCATSYIIRYVALFIDILEETLNEHDRILKNILDYQFFIAFPL